MWQHGLSFATPGMMGGICPELAIMGVCSPKGDKLSYLSRTLQVFTESIVGERRTTGGDFNVV